jgi:effector-binding domain-containing protein
VTGPRPAAGPRPGPAIGPRPGPDYEVSLRAAAACRTAVVAQATTWAEFPGLWRRLLDEVYACIRSGAPVQAGQNVMLYRVDGPTLNVEVGVQVTGSFTPSGRVIASALPAGQVATTVHRGPYDRLDAAHRAVIAWCADHGHELSGARWEIYGDWRETPTSSRPKSAI